MNHVFAVGATGYTRSSGHKYRIIAADLKGDQPLGVALQALDHGYETVYEYSPDGSYYTSREPSAKDLLPPGTEKQTFREWRAETLKAEGYKQNWDVLDQHVKFSVICDALDRIFLALEEQAKK